MIKLIIQHLFLLFCYATLTSGAEPPPAASPVAILNTGKFPVQSLTIKIPRSPAPEMPLGRNATLSLKVKPFHSEDVPPSAILIRWPNDMVLASGSVISTDGMTYEGTVGFTKSPAFQEMLERLQWNRSVLLPMKLWNVVTPQYEFRTRKNVSRTLPKYTEEPDHSQLTIWPRDSFRQGPRCPDIDAARSLLITDTSVVNDLTRTWDAPTPETENQTGLPSAGNPDGKWTFNYLISQMANEAMTGISPSTLAQQWAETWKFDQDVGKKGFYVIGKRPGTFETLARRWPGLAKGKADPAQAPFRLEAIVNRVDLRDNLIFAPRDASGGIDLGELRFVFTLSPTNHQESQFSMILEYGVRVYSLGEAKDYAKRWVELSAHPIGSEHYREKLEALTESVTRAGLGHHRPNGSSLLRLRTHEAVASNPWQFRQWELDASTHLLLPTLLPQTPSPKFNQTDNLRDYLASNAGDIARNVYELPELAPDSSRFWTAVDDSGSGSAFWMPTSGKTGCKDFKNAAYILSFNTCSGCHGRECRMPRDGELFNHIQFRRRGAASRLSSFLTGSVPVPESAGLKDPRYDEPTRKFNDLERRSWQLARLYEIDPMTPLTEVFYDKLRMTH